MTIPHNVTTSDCYVVVVHANEHISKEYARTADNALGPLCSRFAALGEDVIAPAIRERAWDLCRRIDLALVSCDIEGVSIALRVEDGGAFVAELRTATFLMFFSIESEGDELGWGLATHRSSGGILASGSLDFAEITSRLGMILKQRRSYQILSFDASSRIVTVQT